MRKNFPQFKILITHTTICWPSCCIFVCTKPVRSGLEEETILLKLGRTSVHDTTVYNHYSTWATYITTVLEKYFTFTLKNTFTFYFSLFCQYFYFYFSIFERVLLLLLFCFIKKVLFSESIFQILCYSSCAGTGSSSHSIFVSKSSTT